MIIDPFTATAITSGISSILGGIGGQADTNAQNRAIEAQYKQNLQSWQFGKQRLKADSRHSNKQWRLNKQDERTLANYKDTTNLQDWEYKLKIQESEYAFLKQEKAKSDQIYKQQLTFNQMAQAAANEAEYRKLEDSMKELAFQNQDIIIRALQAEGAAAVKGQQGRSAEKGEQAEFAALGRNQAILAESLLSAKADTGAALRKIANDRFGADLAAEANRMLEPPGPIKPPKPLATPVSSAESGKPRKLRRYDFGPRPTKGVMASSAGSWIGAVGGLASSAASIYAAGKSPASG